MKEYLVLLNNQQPISIRASRIIFQQHMERVVVTFKNDQGMSVAEFSKDHFVGYCEKNSLIPEESKVTRETPVPFTNGNSNGNGHYNGNGNGNGYHKHLPKDEDLALNNFAHIMKELEMEADFN